MRPNIAITFPTPFLPIKEYCALTKTSMSTARDMVRDGRLPICKKTRANEKVEINMVALTMEAFNASGYAFALNTQYE
ncbi:regulator [Xenorhabdus khoisanae]|uniref:Regulator n=1 Tax=Xenorhabdus khoisanae TaxID=880157 RepID=A0A0J5FSZ6_9GAMM|nr:hypothetical protein [Xenorhabdus khoisanae]KMJ45428.1 regulator [Xenorhabdus khoisanae]